VADKPPADVFIVNDGPTRADEYVSDPKSRMQKINGRAGELLSAVFGRSEGHDNEHDRGKLMAKTEDSSYWLP